MRFIDSNVIAYACYANNYQERCQEIIKAGGIINTVNIIEAFNIIQQETTREHAKKAIRSILKSHLKIMAVDSNMLFETVKRSLRYPQLKFIDLLHYTTALLYNCSEIISYDRDFNNLEIERNE
mgnify:CR=1 FL=1